jgi:hypothetical protein
MMSSLEAYRCGETVYPIVELNATIVRMGKWQEIGRTLLVLVDIVYMCCDFRDRFHTFT